ncbi:homoserine O-acetyltransferase [Artomyces pyxidatus]|uniref:Homoserine O-acetyltransferase n=1 Tax=Artomyces pyxidatus TaxID=48021 RepID=A0ACB8SUK7_9AGAM|nr:homoserine O-acetyltransferase [Artomyces pyxidatus]
MAQLPLPIDQSIHIVPSFELECGALLRDVPVAYKTWGTLNPRRDNVMIICHAFTGSADVEDWADAFLRWGPLMGRGKAFDPNRFFIFCANVMGSPYGTASPISLNPATGKPYGPEFPSTTIRDDVRLHKLVLDHLGVSSVAVAIGGSMGGMTVLEWPLCSPLGYIRNIIPIATSARHSAWCISWGEAQRQSIYSDPSYEDGFYRTQPSSGLAAARMAALLTYRSRDSFESRFGRKPQHAPVLTPPRSPTHHTAADALAAHNDGNRNALVHTPTSDAAHPPVFSAQSYLRYQGDKFTARFDANCYIHITRKMDTHDLARGRSASLAEVLAQLPPRALVIGVQTDGLFMLSEQRELAESIPGATLTVIQSPDGHDGFLLEFEQINRHILAHLKRELPEHYAGAETDPEVGVDGFEIKKTSMFGEAEADITRW